MTTCNGRLLLRTSLSGKLTEIGSQGFAITGPATTPVNVGLTGPGFKALKANGELTTKATATTHFGTGSNGSRTTTILLAR